MLTFREHSPDCCLCIINMPFYKALYLHSTAWISFCVSTCQLLKAGLLSQRLYILYMLIHIAKQLSKHINFYQKCKTFTSLVGLLNLWQFDSWKRTSFLGIAFIIIDSIFPHLYWPSIFILLGNDLFRAFAYFSVGMFALFIMDL